MLSVNILEMYATQFESLVSLPKRGNKVKSVVKNEPEVVTTDEPGKEAGSHQINYFAGPHNAFGTRTK